MTDNELLELAAKAAGYDLYIMTTGHGCVFNINQTTTEWNPLTDDGDAFRLAAKLKLNINFSGERYSVSKDHVSDICFLYEFGDQMKTLRYAIVGEAAEIGKAMP